jgi:hypothetical protein
MESTSVEQRLSVLKLSSAMMMPQSCHDATQTLRVKAYTSRVFAWERSVSKTWRSMIMICSFGSLLVAN